MCWEKPQLAFLSLWLVSLWLGLWLGWGWGYLRRSTCLPRCPHLVAQHVWWFSVQNGQCLLPHLPLSPSTCSHQQLSSCLSCPHIGGLSRAGSPEVKQAPICSLMIIQQVLILCSSWGPHSGALPSWSCYSSLGDSPREMCKMLSA